MKLLREHQISRRSILKGLFLSLGYAVLGDTAYGATLSKYNIVLGGLQTIRSQLVS